MEEGDKAAAVSIADVEEALRALGLLFGAKRSLADVAAGTGDESELIRAYIMRERPHLLCSYDIETLIELVRITIRERARHGPVMEQFSPRG